MFVLLTLLFLVPFVLFAVFLHLFPFFFLDLDIVLVPVKSFGCIPK